MKFVLNELQVTGFIEAENIEFQSDTICSAFNT